MARTTTISRVSYSANGATTAFAYNFPMIQASNAVVTLTDLTGTETTQTLTTHYTITVNSNGGTVTFLTAPTSGFKVTIRRVIPLTQSSDWSNGSAVSQQTFEDAVDKLTDLSVQMQEQIDRAPKFKLSSTFTSIQFPELVAGKAIRVNDAGTGLQVSDLTFDTMLSDITTQANLAIAARIAADADAAVVAADKAIVITDMNTVAADKAIVAADKATVAADKAIVIADMNTVAADKAIVAADKAIVIADMNTVAADMAATATYRSEASTYRNEAVAARDNAELYKNDALAHLNNTITNANNAATSASNAATSETNAAASAAIASNAAAGSMYNSVVDKTANYTVLTTDIGALIRVDTSSGAITITLPSVATAGEGFRIAIAKTTSDTNAVNIVRAGSDTINGGTTYQLTSQWSAATIVADSATTSWFAIGTGAGAGNITVDTFTGNGSTVAFTLTAGPGSTNSTNVFLDGNYQNKSTYSVSGTTLTFTTAPPSGVAIEVEYGGTLSVGTPADNTVSTVKLVDSSVTTAKISDANVTVAKLSATGTANSTTFLRGDGTWNAPGGGGAIEYVSTTTVSGSPSSVEFTGLASGYDYFWIITNWTQTGNGYYTYVKIGYGGTPTYLNSNYRYVLVAAYTGSISAANQGGYGDSAYPIFGALPANNSSYPACGRFEICDVGSSAYKQVNAFGMGEFGNPTMIHEITGTILDGSAITAVKFYPGGSNTITSGTLVQYRRKRSS